ncbi:M14 family metallopeptidase [Staphylococcus epidermidis]|uniref:M14 family metallopeptidase n=1 Tax=Staphylococcus epidermidis TaxID=1282 RepID=UPI002094501A|nr:M14 family metallopeptidase [Staphylococcus epidermidis]MCO6312749.1 M14 family metallopeptidase [Staphylococcus epidermidis]
MRRTIYTKLDTLFSARYVRENELNYIAIRDMLTNIEEILEKHGKTQKRAHNSEQVVYTLPTGPDVTVGQELGYQSKRIRNLVLGTIGNGLQEVRDSRTSIDAQNFPILSERLRHDFTRVDNKIDKELNVADDDSYLFTPPFIPSSESGVNGTPNNNDPDENRKVFYDKFVDNKYVTKKYVGKDQSNKYNVYAYDFKPDNYTKTLLVTSCIHGNEYSAFYALSHFMNLVVNEWHKYSHLAYLRKNVRIVLVPIVNPWGFANRERENVNNVDLNRNFDYYWSNGSGTRQTGANYKGSKPFSERESRNMKALVEGVGDITAHVDCHNIISQVSDYCLFYPRFANQPNNVMTEMLSEMSDHGDYVTWGSSTLASFSNWVGIKHGTTSFLPEVYEGRAGVPRGAQEMWRSVYYLGNIICKLAKLDNSREGRIANQPIVKSLVYSSRFDKKDTKPFSLIAKKDYQRMLMTQQRFQVTANGFVELNGSITVEVDRDTTIAVAPYVVQNYHPYSGNGKSRRRHLYRVRMPVKKGWHTIPLHAIAPVQYSTTSPDNVHRSNEVMGVVDILRTKGVARVRNMIINLTFTPSHAHTAIQILKSGGYGNQKEKTFHQVYPNKPSAYTKTNKIIHKTKKK